MRTLHAISARHDPLRGRECREHHVLPRAPSCRDYHGRPRNILAMDPGEVSDFPEVPEAIPFGSMERAPLTCTLSGGLDLLLVAFQPAPLCLAALQLHR